MTDPKVPTKPGFYWAKWMLADDNVPEGTRPYKVWEPVEVFMTDYSEGTDELRVDMLGSEIERGQSLDCFHWGDELTPPPDVYAALRNAQHREERRMAARRYKAMTPDQREEFLQAERRKRRLIP